MSSADVRTKTTTKTKHTDILHVSLLQERSQVTKLTQNTC